MTIVWWLTLNWLNIERCCSPATAIKKQPLHDGFRRCYMNVKVYIIVWLGELGFWWYVCALLVPAHLYLRFLKTGFELSL
ncbi:hypothetical protein PEC301889_21610 [Pectobacterium carotovorum subsp. carotovorum]|nr:hypothetical protein PEC301889_21610 [Pectobacterium carotovorum subsp. carotovorum]